MPCHAQRGSVLTEASTTQRRITSIILRLILESKQCPTQRERGQATESAPAMGFGRTGLFESQQGRLRRANKLARIAWASWANGTCFDANYQAVAA